MFEDISPYYHLFFSLKENNEEEFEKSFPVYLAFMELNHVEDFQKCLIEDCNHLLFAAREGNHNRAIKLIIGCYTNDKDLSDDYIKFMLKMIDNEFYLGRELKGDSIDQDWIEPDMLEKFLNSSVSKATDKSGKNMLKIDYTCLIDPEIRDIHLQSLKDQPESLLFNKSMRSVSMILNNDKLRHLITHPMIELFVTLKANKT